MSTTLDIMHIYSNVFIISPEDKVPDRILISNRHMTN